MEDRSDAWIGLGVEVQGKIARDREDAGFPDIPLLVEPEELVEEGVVGPGRDEFVRIIETDDERGVLAMEPGGDPLLDLAEVPAGRRRRATADLCEDAPVDGKRSVVVATVDVDRDDPLRLLRDRGKEVADGGGLSRPRRAAEDGTPRARAPEGGLEEEGEFPGLGVAVVEVIGEIREFKDLGVAKERLVGAEEGRMRHTSLWRRGGC